jgi:hypothetical protein
MQGRSAKRSEIHQMTAEKFVTDLLMIEVEASRGDPEYRCERLAKLVQAFEQLWAFVLLTYDLNRHDTPEQIVETAYVERPELFDRLCDLQVASKPWVNRGMVAMLKEKSEWEVSIPRTVEALEAYAAGHPGRVKQRAEDLTEVIARLVDCGLIPAELKPADRDSPEAETQRKAGYERAMQLKEQIKSVHWRWYRAEYPGSDARLFRALHPLIVAGQLDEAVAQEEMQALRAVVHQRAWDDECDLLCEARGELVREFTEDGFPFWRVV